MLPTPEELWIGFVPYSPLGKGFLTGKINENTAFDSSDFRNTLPCFTPRARKANQALVDLLGMIGERKKTTPADSARFLCSLRLGRRLKRGAIDISPAASAQDSHSISITRTGSQKIDPAGLR